MEMPKMQIVGNKEKVSMPSAKVKIKEKDNKDNEFSEKLKKVLREKGYDIWSYSRLSSWGQCKYEYYLNYIERDKNKLKAKRNNIYGLLGGIVHECLEGFFLGEYTQEDMKSKFELIYADSKVPKVDQTSILRFPSEKIEKTYIDCLRLFFRDYKLPQAPVMRNEDFVWHLFNNDKIAVQGFIDLVLGYVNADGGKYAIIQDFKTSTKFSSSDILEKGRQLVVYAYMYQQRTGIPVKRVEWNMLKYCQLSIPTTLSKLKSMKVGELKTLLGDEKCKLKKDELVNLIFKKNLFQECKKISYQRNEIYLKINKEVSKYLKALGVDELTINRNMALLCQYQNIKYLEKDIYQKLLDVGFSQNDWILEYNLTEEIFDEMENFIINTTQEINNTSKDTSKDLESLMKEYPPLLDVNYPSKNALFYCSNLCGFAKSKNGEPICEFYKNYLNKL